MSGQKYAQLPEQKYLLQRLELHPCGRLVWRAQPHLPWWNGKFAGKTAFTRINGDGYRCGKIDRTFYFAHRVIWKMVHGYDPDVIDHINRDRADNRPENLRSCTHAENSRNCRMKVGKSSIYRGVSWDAREAKWRAQISNGKRSKIGLGLHRLEIDAAFAYDDAAARLHGVFATLNFSDDIRSTLKETDHG